MTELELRAAIKAMRDGIEMPRSTYTAMASSLARRTTHNKDGGPLSGALDAVYASRKRHPIEWPS